MAERLAEGNMAFFEKTGRFIDWLTRGEMVFRILVAMGVGKLVQTLIATGIPERYHTAIWLLSSAAVFWMLLEIGRWWNKKKGFVVQTTALAAPSKVISAQVEEYRTNLDAEMVKETEANIQAEANGYHDRAERELFLLRGFSTTLLMGFYEITWYIIFSSQIKALERLNKGTATLEELRPYYDMNAEKRPQYPFESWFGYMKEQALLLQDGFNIKITVRGKGFLKYLVLHGRTAGDKER